MSTRRPRVAVVVVAAIGLAACGGSSARPPSSPSEQTDVATTVSASLVLPSPLPTTRATSSATAASTTVGTPPPPTTAPTTTAAATTVATTAASPDCTSSIPLRARVAQLVWPAVYGDALRTSAAQLAEWGVGGAVVMTFPAGAKAADLLALKQAGAVPLLLATDEEGGRVQRFKLLGAMPAPEEVARSMTVDAAEAMVADHAATLAKVGIDIVFAPVVDVRPADGSPGPIGDRSFGSDPSVVEAYAAAYVSGWQRAGITPVLKHFPGHGAATGDTHDGFASTAPLDDLRQRDLLPYAALATSGAAVMVGHLDVPGLTEPGLPASLSPAALGLLREQYGYGDALVFTDALGMDAVTQRYSLPKAAELALVAGDDVVIFTATEQTPAVIDRLVAAVEAGRLSEQRVDDALARVLRAKHLDACAMAQAVG